MKDEAKPRPAPDYDPVREFPRPQSQPQLPQTQPAAAATSAVVSTYEPAPLGKPAPAEPEPRRPIEQLTLTQAAKLKILTRLDWLSSAKPLLCDVQAVFDALTGDERLALTAVLGLDGMEGSTREAARVLRRNNKAVDDLIASAVKYMSCAAEILAAERAVGRVDSRPPGPRVDPPLPEESTRG